MDNGITTSYNDFLEILRLEFSDFIRIAESGRTTRHASLKARKKSIFLRKMLKDFRNVALENDKRITRIMYQAKKQITDNSI